MTTETTRHCWYLSKSPVLADLPAAELQSLAQAAELCERRRNTTLYLAGDFAGDVYFLHGGRVSSLYITSTHRTVSLGLYGPTEVFGESCLWSSAPRDDTAVTATSVLLSRIPRALLRAVLDAHGRIEQRLSELAVVRRDATIRRLAAALTSSVRARLAGQLLELAEHGRDTPDGRELAFSLTHHELAALIGTTRESVSLELGRLERSRLLIRRGRRILLRDLRRLLAQARDDLPPRRRVIGGTVTAGVVLGLMP
ncbi:Crp/Fnr family transcriptional regulator [Nannocystis pusilla]|uniref:Crp/Fnr family transcriptional regulator n=1 Tax=Nannocystis pusilla TaxID=889268 RepID=A0ABS7U0A8_9BACT|nr:Crp/Fnr family transcriptional regulator [Nannocystis pusilla]MBZ5713955.1 Crp/Fnr family transcriptional regulator [Nannocystis pusilla]